jgi:hypothetical protein
MIRIDEIYYNVFVKAMQDNPQVGLHWFDPFGTTQFENICSIPAVYGVAQHRLLFYDQEPLQQDRLRDFMDQYIKIYKGPTTLITSERDSENVDWACNTYGLKSDYYFFHGWAALDWYRGYDKTFLIKPVEQRKPTKTFISPNRIIAGQRQHRLEMLYWIFKLGLTDNHISCPAVCPVENISITDAAKSLPFNDVASILGSQQLPINFANETNHPMHSCWLSLFDEAADSLLYLVTETVADGCRHHLTEKTFKPIAMGMPFVIVGTQGSLEYLRSYGFKTFGHIWDETYDTIQDPHERIRSIASLLQTLCDLPVEERIALFRLCQETIEHNWNHFYNGGFEAVLWEELQGVVNRAKSSL